MSYLRLFDAFSGTALFFIVDWYWHESPHKTKEIGFVLFLLILVVLHHARIYRSWRFSSPFYEIKKIFLGCLTVYAISFFLFYFQNISYHVSRDVFFCWMIIWPLLLSIVRLVIRLVLRWLRKRGVNCKNTIIVGANAMGMKLSELIKENPWSGMKVLGFFDDHVKKNKKASVLGRLDQIIPFISNHQVDIIYISLSINEQNRIHQLLQRLSDSTVSIFFIPDFFFADLMIGGHLTYFENFPVISLQESPIIGVNRFVKRFFDVIFSLAALIVLSPLFVCIAMALKMNHCDKIIFKQWRYGLNGQPIQVFKFRTMTSSEDGYDFNQVVKNDPRVTRFGAFLRKNSLDELPQLFNVLIGNMSLVGPRPHPVAMNETYRKLVPGYMLRHKVKPGITGLAQLNGFRGETDTMSKVESRIKYDIAYIQNWSFWSDVKILWKTILSGSWRTNAY